MPKHLKLAAALMFGISSLANTAQAEPAAPKPTIVLVHGAFAESESWDGVITRLTADGFRVVAAANPLRSVAGDAAYISSILNGIEGPIVLAGHSYGGTVISTAAVGHPNVRALVFVSGFLPEVGESSATLSNQFPGSTLAPTLSPPVALPDGNMDVYIQQERFRDQFAADVPAAEAAVMAATQRPITQAALGQPAGGAAWRTIPSYSIYGSLDRNIPAAAHAFMARRAQVRHVIEVQGSSHVVMISHPREVAALIEEAAAAQ